MRRSTTVQGLPGGGGVGGMPGGTPSMYGADLSMAADFLRYHPFVVHDDIILGSANVNVKVAAPASSVASLGIYSADREWYPGWRMGDLGARPIDAVVLQTWPAAGPLRLDGGVGNTARTPWKTEFTAAGDLRVTVQASTDVRAKGANQILASHWQSGGGRRGWWVGLTSGGFPRLSWSTTGLDVLTATATAISPFGDGVSGYRRVTLDVDNGAGGHTVTFETSADGVAWTQLGDQIVGAGTTSVFGTKALEADVGVPLRVGDWSDPAGLPAIGNYSSFKLERNGVTVASPAFSQTNQVITDAQGVVWLGPGGFNLRLPRGRYLYSYHASGAGTVACWGYTVPEFGGMMMADLFTVQALRVARAYEAPTYTPTRWTTKTTASKTGIISPAVFEWQPAA